MVAGVYSRKKLPVRVENMASQISEPKVLDLGNSLAARILANPDIAVFLKPFMREALTIKKAAEELKLSIQNMHYRVEQMEQAGLLDVVGIEARRGRPIKHYQATATAFRIRVQSIPEAVMQALNDHIFWKRQLERGLEGAFGLSKYQEHMVVYLDKDGLLVWGSDLEEKAKDPEVLTDDFPAVLNMWTGGLRLNRSDAKALQRELWQVCERYAHRGGEGRYVMHLGLAPTE